MKASVACSAMLSVVVTAQAPVGAVTQWFRCYPIRPGDTTAQIARRLTGADASQQAAWFQVFDARRRLVSKRRYGEVHVGWRACIAEAQRPAASAAPVAEATATAGVEEQSGARELDLPPRVSVRPSIVEDPVLWWLLSFGFGASAVALFVVAAGRKRAWRTQVMRRFGDDFVREFGRPWTSYRAAGPMPRAQLRVMPLRSRVDILVAPAQGRTYPNLSDHRCNVEYDVARVTAALRQQSFAGGRPYSEGDWVVLPFQFTGESTKEGVR